jgi:uncharacterized protein (TIGR02266 family)
MSQETRKDARAKIVSLNVRYKSATVDEFIENHSYDVSKGGVFIKTATPFAAGTLLKFEIRIAGDVSVIGGVGRVVWTRRSTSSYRPKGTRSRRSKKEQQKRGRTSRLRLPRPPLQQSQPCRSRKRRSPRLWHRRLRSLAPSPSLPSRSRRFYPRLLRLSLRHGSLFRTLLRRRSSRQQRRRPLPLRRLPCRAQPLPSIRRQRRRRRRRSLPASSPRRAGRTCRPRKSGR